MTWQKTILWIMAAGMIFSGAGACIGKAVTPDTPPAKQPDAPKTVLGVNSLNGIAVSHDPVDGQSGTPEIVAREGDVPASSAPDETSAGSSVVPGAILDKPARFGSGTVSVRGVFHGWRGPCPGGPPVSRGDWMIADPSGCLYVHGPVPTGLDPASPSGETISVTGVVRMKNGRPYLEAGLPKQ